MPRILLLEDEPDIADTLVYALRSEGFEVMHVTLARDALALVSSASPDLAILDIGVPDGNGFDVCRAIRRESQLPVLFLTARTQEIDRVLGLELGADDYVGKPFSPREVCARVRAILRRSAGSPAAGLSWPAPDAVAACPAPQPPGGSPALWLDEAAQRVRCGGRYLPLTRYEFLLLATLLRQPGRIYSRAELMTRVWADAPDTADRTVDAHVKLLRAKLRAQGVSADVIQTHRHMGYSLQLAPD